MSDHHRPRPRRRRASSSATTTRSAPRSRTQLGLGNIMQVPAPREDRDQHGRRRGHRRSRRCSRAPSRDLTIITGQKPIVTKAKKSIAGFKLREGNAIGAKVTLRGDRMWEFLDRLISVAIPRIRDFRGLAPDAFDGRGNYTFGVTEQLIFPEIDYDKVDATRGMDITIVTTARTDAEGKALLDAFGFPFKREGQQELDGQEGAHQQAAAQAEVQGPRLHPLPPLRPPARGVPQVRPLPHLPARAGPRRRGPRRDQGQLVRGGDTMTMTDPIADMLTRIRNANVAMHDEVRMPSLEAEGGARRDPRARRATSRASTSPTTPSEPGQRADDQDEVLARAGPHDLRPAPGVQAGPAGLQPRPTKVPRVLGGLGVAVLSTSQGLMTDREARKRNVGGEVLCYVW